MMHKWFIVGFIYSGIEDINVCYKMNNTGIFDVYGDAFHPGKNEEITIVSANINGLCTEGWSIKNDQVQDFALSTQADVLAL